MAKKTGRNEPCPCGSGKKFKRCHGGMEELGLAGVETVGGLTIDYSTVKAKALLTISEDQRLQGWLLERAAAAFRASQMPGGDHYQVLLTVLLSAFAAEALVNRLLEPLLPPDEWGKVERELGTPEKWMRLYEHLRLKPDVMATQKLKGLFALRDALVHLKHSGSLIRKEQQVPFRWAMNPLGQPPKGVPDVVTDPKLRERLEPRWASDYYGCVHDLLAGVLDAHPSDPHQVVEHLREVLGENAQAPDRLVPSGLGQQQRAFIDEMLSIFEKLIELLSGLLGRPPEQKTDVERIACAFLARARSLLYGVYSLSTTGQGLEVAALGSALVDLAVVASWVRGDARRVSRLMSSGIVAQNALAERLAHNHGFVWGRAALDDIEAGKKHLDELLHQHGQVALEIPARTEMARDAGLEELVEVSGSWLRWMHTADYRSLIVEARSEGMTELFVALYDTGRAALAAVQAPLRVLGLADQAQEVIQKLRDCLTRAEISIDRARGGSRVR